MGTMTELDARKERDHIEANAIQCARILNDKLINSALNESSHYPINRCLTCGCDRNMFGGCGCNGFTRGN